MFSLLFVALCGSNFVFANERTADQRMNCRILQFLDIWRAEFASIVKDDYAGGAAVPSTLFRREQEGQELPLAMNSFHLSNLVKGHFPVL